MHAQYDRLIEVYRTLEVWEQIGEIVQEEFVPMDDINEGQD